MTNTTVKKRKKINDKVIYFKNIEKTSLPPAQFHLFTGEPIILPQLIDKDIDEELEVSRDVTLVHSKDGANLILSGYGLFIGKKGERLIVRQGKSLIYEFPFFRLCEITIESRGITISSDLIMDLCKRGIQINFLKGTGSPYAKIESPMLSATIQARRQQFVALDDERGLQFAKSIVMGKLKNQKNLLLYFGKYIKKRNPNRFEKLLMFTSHIKRLAVSAKRINGKCIKDVRMRLMGIEGTASRIYWEGVEEIISDKVEFFGRITRGAKDKVNSLLNYSYGMLYSQVWGAIVSAGLEPFAGFLHVDRPGKPSLVLDLVEEFRQPVVDRTVIAHVNLGEKIELKNGLLTSETKETISRKILERLTSKETYRGRKYQIRSIIQIQARNLASFLKGGKAYKPFSFKW